MPASFTRTALSGARRVYARRVSQLNRIVHIRSKSTGVVELLWGPEVKQTKTVFLNKWAILLVALLLLAGTFAFGINAAYWYGKGLVYLLVALIVLWAFGLRFNIR